MPLSEPDRDHLNLLQTNIDASGDFAAQVVNAKAAFDAKPAGLFSRVRDNLAGMAGELVRCGYCEDSCADEVEHIRPKDFYPENTFRWSNFLFSCGPCNGRKSNRYCVMVGDQRVELKEHRRKFGIVVPPLGMHVFIDPRSENPLDYIWMDIASKTFILTALDEDDLISEVRATTTIEYLRLNREPLRAARANAYGGYKDRLSQLAHRSQQNAPAEELTARLKDIGRSPHRTVWLEMKRQASLIPSIDELFKIVPVALSV